MKKGQKIRLIKNRDNGGIPKRGDRGTILKIGAGNCLVKYPRYKLKWWTKMDRIRPIPKIIDKVNEVISD